MSCSTPSISPRRLTSTATATPSASRTSRSTGPIAVGNSRRTSRQPVAEHVDLLGEQLLQVRLDAVLDQARVDAELVRRVGAAPPRRSPRSRSPVLFSTVQVPGAGVVDVGAQGAGRAHPVQRLVRPAVGVHRAPSRRPSRAAGASPTGRCARQPAGVVHASSGRSRGARPVTLADPAGSTSARPLRWPRERERPTTTWWWVPGARAACSPPGCRRTRTARVLVLEAGGDDADRRDQDPGGLLRPCSAPSTTGPSRPSSRSTCWAVGWSGRGARWSVARRRSTRMLYIRGNRLDYDTWRDAYGCAGWGFADLLPYFKKAEDNARGASDYHGTGGPLRVEDLRSVARAEPRLRRVGGRARHQAQRRLQRAGAGRRRALPGHPARRAPVVGRRRLPAAGARPAEPATWSRDALVTRVVVEGGRAVGVRVPRPGREPRRPVRRRGAALGRRDQQPAAAHAVRRRPGRRTSGSTASPSSPDVTGVGAQPAGPPGRRRPLADPRHHEPARPRDRSGSCCRWQLLKRGPLTSPVAEACAFLRTRPDAAGPRPAVPRRGCCLPRQRARRAVRPRLHGRRDARVGGEPRLSAARRTRPALVPDDRRRLPQRGGGPRGAARRE